MKLQNTDIKPVVLCGGSGTRLWPLSRKSCPKQFATFFDNKSLLQTTLERVSLISPGSEVFTVCNEEYRFIVRDTAKLAGVNCKNILEPIGKNTTAAMAAAALNSEKEQLLLFVPSDHYIPDSKLFSETIKKGIHSALEGAFVTFGINPTEPNTGYGYIEVYEKKNQSMKVKSFTEKPNSEEALKFIATNNFFWNAGIFLVQAKILIDSIKKYAPDIYSSVSESVENQVDDLDFIHLEKSSFSKCRSESIDYAVLEHFTKIHMVSFAGIWSDVGSWNSVSKMAKLDENNNTLIGQVRSLNSSGIYVHSPSRLAVTIGLKDLVIIDTSDAILVSSKCDVDKIKEVVSELKKEKISQGEIHSFDSRPWGKYHIIDEGKNFKVKRISVLPGARLSLQSHKFRAEHWIVIAGQALVTIENKEFLLKENESTYIPNETIHRLENTGKIILEIIEVQTGSYLGEDDIKRYDDRYGRV